MKNVLSLSALVVLSASGLWWAISTKPPTIGHEALPRSEVAARSPSLLDAQTTPNSLATTSLATTGSTIPPSQSETRTPSVTGSETNGYSGDEGHDAGNSTFAPLPKLIPPSEGNTGSSDVLFEYDIADAYPVSGSVVGGVIKQGEASVANEFTSANDDYRFPKLVDTDTGERVMVIGDDPIPTRSSRRELLHGDGPRVVAGDRIQLRYDIFSWSTGELVESSNDTNNPLVNLTLGKMSDLENLPSGLQNTVLQNALLNRTVGSRIQVVYEKSMNGLPKHFNQHDGFVVIVDIDGMTPSDSKGALN